MPSDSAHPDRPSDSVDSAARPVNTTVWIIGPDDAPTAIEYEQSDGNVYLLCKVSDADATGLGMFVTNAALGMGMSVRQSMESRLTR